VDHGCLPPGVALRAETDSDRLTYHCALSNELSNNSSALSPSGASMTELRHTKCQVVLLLSGGLGTENRKVGGSTPPLATNSQVERLRQGDCQDQPPQYPHFWRDLLGAPGISRLVPVAIKGAVPDLPVIVNARSASTPTSPPSYLRPGLPSPLTSTPPSPGPTTPSKTGPPTSPCRHHWIEAARSAADRERLHSAKFERRVRGVGLKSSSVGLPCTRCTLSLWMMTNCWPPLVRSWPRSTRRTFR
jgi:hypothetical protein